MADRLFAAVVFDWDGTLVDSTSLIADSILRAADEIGVPVPDRGQAWHVIGLGLAQALAQVVPDLPRQRIPEFAACYHAHFIRQEGRVRMFDGAMQMLERLRERGVPLAVATGRTVVEFERSRRHNGLDAFFAAVRCADQTHPKPHPAMLLELAQELAVEPADMVMIGDTTHDLEMASSAGAEAAAVAYGAHSRVALERLQPRAIFDNVAQLHEWVLARC